MAGDQLALMSALGFVRFDVVGHDRGARVAHRLALDAPDAVARVAVLDILPTRTLLRQTDLGFATAYWHWFFLLQPGGLPERMIGADPEWFVGEILARWSAYPDRIDPAAAAEYARRFTPAAIAASCADYRAAAGPDLAHDDADAAAGRRVTQPLLALWGAHGAMGRMYDVLASWQEVAERAQGAPGRLRALPRRGGPGRDARGPGGLLRGLLSRRSAGDQQGQRGQAVDRGVRGDPAPVAAVTVQPGKAHARDRQRQEARPEQVEPDIGVARAEHDGRDDRRRPEREPAHQTAQQHSPEQELLAQAARARRC